MQSSPLLPRGFTKCCHLGQLISVPVLSWLEAVIDLMAGTQASQPTNSHNVVTLGALLELQLGSQGLPRR